MRKQILLFTFILGTSSIVAQQATISGPDNQLKVDVSVENGKTFYSVTYKEKQILENSPLGFVADIGDFSKGMTYVDQKSRSIKENYLMGHRAGHSIP